MGHMKKKDYLQLASAIMIITGLLFFIFTYIGIPLPLSTVSPSHHGLSFSMSSTNPNHGLLLASIPTLAVSHTYNWSLTIVNTGTLSFTPHLTIRIAIPNSTTIVEPGTSSYLGADGGSGLVQVCPGGAIDSNSCLVNLQAWKLTAESNGESILGGSSQVLTIDLTNTFAPGQSITVYFTTTVPNGTASGTYPVISNLVAYSSAVGSDVIGYNEQNILVGTVAGTYSLEELGAIALSIVGTALAAISIGSKRF
jgi:hypothetical protein